MPVKHGWNDVHLTAELPASARFVQRGALRIHPGTCLKNNRGTNEKLLCEVDEYQSRSIHSPENRPSPKEISSSNHHFSGAMLNLGEYQSNITTLSHSQNHGSGKWVFLPGSSGVCAIYTCCCSKNSTFVHPISSSHTSKQKHKNVQKHRKFHLYNFHLPSSKTF